MTLLARGAGLRNMITAGAAKDAELEARENQTAAAIDQAKQAQEMTTLGAGAGIGAMYGMKGAAATGAAGAPVGQAVLSSAPEAASIAGDTAMLLTDGKMAAMGGEVLTTTTSAGVGTAGAGAGGAVAGGGGTVAAGAGGGGAVAGSGGAMASLSTIAAPIAIGLGVAYLINELFD